MIALAILVAMGLNASPPDSRALGQHNADVDTVAPAVPTVSVHEIVRGREDNGGLGRIFLSVSGTDNKTPSYGLAYRLTLASGKLPEGLEMPKYDWHPSEVLEEEGVLRVIRLTWNDGRSDIQEPFNFQIAVLAVDRAGNVSEASDTVRVASSGSHIDVVFRFGVGPTNNLDTRRGQFTKDMIADPPITLNLTLTDDERHEVLTTAQRIGFFQLPRVISPDTSNCMVTPCGKYYLRIIVDHLSHEVSWNNCACWEMESLRDLRLMIQKMIISKEAYKRSPKPKGAYL
jgi:hypothetical protein